MQATPGRGARAPRAHAWRAARPARPALAGRLLAALALACAGAAGLAAAPDARADKPAPAATLLSASRAGVVFDVDVPEPRLVPVTAEDGAWQRVELPGFAGDAGRGLPDLPASVVWIAVPEGARVVLQATGEGARLYDGVRLLPAGAAVEAPSAGAALPGRGAAIPAPFADRAAYARPGFGDAPPAQILAVTHLRDQRVARLVIRPAAYDPSLGRLRVYARVRVSVAFEGGEPAPQAPAGGLASPGTGPTAADPFEDVYRTLLNYESARPWRRDPAAGSLRRQGLVPNAVRTPTGQTVRQDFSSSPNWIKLSVSTKGLYRIDATDLAQAGVDPAGIDPRTIRVFTRPGLPVLDELSPPSGWMSEVAVNVVGESDGAFDPGDYVQLFALGPSGWRDEFGAPDSTQPWLDHPYETRNYYWLTWGGSFTDPPRRWTTRRVAPDDPSAVTATDYPAHVHLEQDFDYRPNLQEGGAYHASARTFWEKWFWFELSDRMGAVPFALALPNVVTSKPARLKARLWGDSYEIYSSLGVADHYLDVAVNGQAFAERAFYGTTRQDFDTTFTPLATGNRMTAQVHKITDRNNPNRWDRIEVAWINVDYARTFTPQSEALDFRSPDTTGSFAYGLGPFLTATGLTLLDTTDPLSPVLLTGAVVRDTTGGKAVYFDDPAAGRRMYLATNTTSVRHPDAAARVVLDDLLAPGNGADWVVISYDGFLDAARSLAAHRATRVPGVANPRTRVVKVSDVYAWYSGGRVDPTAIRNFLYDAERRLPWSPAPAYVCFLGDASYDFKNLSHLPAPGNFVPTYPNGWQTGAFSTDDWLVDMDLGVTEPWPNGPPPGYPDSIAYDVPDLAAGRIPASNAGEADFLVNQKIIPYEASPVRGEWRDHVLLVADDVFQGTTPDPLGTQHMYYSENIAQADLAPSIVPDKLYLIQYPYGSGTEKPLANKAVKDAVNDGRLIWNYIGHGNPFKMADENAFILSDVPSLTNLGRLTFLIAASCDLGKFDDALVTGLGESLIKSRAGGAIATFSATEIAFANANVALAEALFQALFAETPAGFQTPLGKAVLKAKTRPTFLSVNDEKYVLMGDPAMMLAVPREYVRLSLSDAVTSAPATSLTRGRRLLLQGAVSPTHDPLATDFDAAFNGTASLFVTDSPPRDTATAGVFDTLAYRYTPGVIFHGDVPVVNGRFTAQFVVPLEAALGDRARVTVYADDPRTDGAGAVITSVAPGTPATVDTTGPTIALAFTNGGTRVPPDATLRIAVSDANGINLTGHTVPNALFLTIDDQTRFDLTQSFRYDAGSYQAGKVEFPLPGLAPGPHSITVSAADNYAQGVLGRKNRSTATIQFVVEESGALSLGQVYNFPNPFAPAGGTSFVLTGLTEPAKVQIKVYTVSGSLVRILETEGGPGQVQVRWDGRDERGDRLANGAYTYLVQAQGQASGAVIRYRGRAAVLR